VIPAPLVNVVLLSRYLNKLNDFNSLCASWTLDAFLGGAAVGWDTRLAIVQFRCAGNLLTHLEMPISHAL